MSRTFLKMNGLGNDVVVIQTLTESFEPTPADIRAIAKLDGGVGCDQVIAIDPPKAEGASAYVRFWNSDGDEIGACGNGTRCVAWLLMQSSGKDAVSFDTEGGRLSGVMADLPRSVSGVNSRGIDMQGFLRESVQPVSLPGQDRQATAP
mgnify:CR=1 FL=1